MKNLLKYQSKKNIRSVLKDRRNQHSRQDRFKRDRQISYNFIDNQLFKRARVIACFLSFGSEVQTRDIIRASWDRNKIVLIPDVSAGFASPHFVRYQPWDKLMRDKYGISKLRYPKTPFPFFAIDIVLVPGLGFDRKGYRIGSGGGVYDRIIRNTPNAQHIGLFYAFQRLHQLPRSNWDLPLDRIVTDTENMTISNILRK